MSESFPKPEKLRIHEIRPTEDVLDAFGRAREEYSEPPKDLTEKIDAYHALHNTLEYFENGEMIALYENGQVPTFESLQKAIDQTQEALQGVSDPEAQSISKLLIERITNMKTWARKYVTAVLRFKRAKERMIAEAGGDEREAFRRADEERRRIHDALLDALKTYNSLLQKATEFAEFKQPAAWSQGMHLPENTAWNYAVIFSPNALADRDLIRDWAIVADRESEIKKLTGYPPPPSKQ
jgi:hypothetical protein